MDKEMNKSEEKSISYLAKISLDCLTDVESKAVMDLFERVERIETSKGYIWGFNTGITNFNSSQNAIFADVAVKDYGCLAEVFQEFIAKTNVLSQIHILGRAGDFSMRAFLAFADGKLVDCEYRNFYDNGVLDSNEDTFIESSAKKLGIDLDKITYDDPEVFAAFQNQDIMKWSFVYSCEDSKNDQMAILKPKSMNDLMVYYAAVMRADENDGMEAVKEYVDYRDGLKPIPENLQEGLKNTYGMVFFSEQKELLKPEEWSVPQPMPTLAAKLNSEFTYKFVYLCVKYGVHKDLK